MIVSGILLAAGKSSRFGREKLLESMGGKRMIEWSMEALRISEIERRIAVVPPSLGDVVSEDFHVLLNEKQELGISHSIHLAVSYANESNAILFHLADQPFVGPDVMRKMISIFLKNDRKIVAAAVNGDPRNPMVFPRKYYGDLLSLSGDNGAKSVAMSHISDVLMVEVDEATLMDIDTVGDLEKARTLRG
ncbi:MAG: nucleotidyltransferase family protein [Thermoplasmata archaeon]